VYAYVLRTPDAKLFDEPACRSERTMGPTWTFTADGSSVVGVRNQGTNVAGAIAWLLLRAVSNTGSGRFSDVTFIRA
jgi:hypothetical protein